MVYITRVKTYFAKFSEDEIFGMSSALAFCILSSLIPVIALAYFVFALLGGFQHLRDAVEQYAFQYIAPSLANSLSEYVRTIEVKVSPKALGIFGLIGFLYSGLTMIGQAEWSLNKIWGAVTPRTILQRIFRYCSALVVAPVLLGGSLAMTSYMAAKLGSLKYFPKALLIVLTAAPYLFTSVLFAGVYYYLPNTKVDKRAAVISGLCTGLTFELLKQGFAFYASYALKTSIYGSLAALPIMVLWMYLMALVFLAGGELCYFLDQKRKGVDGFAPSTSLLSIKLLRDILEIFCDPNHTEPLGISEVVRKLNWDQSVVLKHVHFLVQAKIIKLAEHSNIKSECFESIEKDFGRNLLRLTEELNRVRYEHVEVQPAPAARKSSRAYWDAPIELR